DGAGIVGQQLRDRLVRDFKAKIVLRSARDAVEVIGASGTGKHQVVSAAHAVARDVLGRTGPMQAFDCGGTDASIDRALSAAIDQANGGTLVLDRFASLAGDQRATATRVIRDRSDDALIIAVSREDAGAAEPRTA